MSARNVYHDCVIRALTRDGWVITHDPYPLSYGGKNLAVDLGAERTTLAAERAGEKIAVEVSSFVGRSAIKDLENAVGQFDVYRAIMRVKEPERLLYLAVPRRVQKELLDEPFGLLIMSSVQLKVLVFDEDSEEVVRWIS
jgi:hypothetical protein